MGSDLWGPFGNWGFNNLMTTDRIIKAVTYDYSEAGPFETTSYASWHSFGIERWPALTKHQFKTTLHKALTCSFIIYSCFGVNDDIPWLNGNALITFHQRHDTRLCGVNCKRFYFQSKVVQWECWEWTGMRDEDKDCEMKERKRLYIWKLIFPLRFCFGSGDN